mgnify:CR=1 FL=1
MYSLEENKQRHLDAVKRWRKNHPEKAKENQLKQNEKRKEERRNGVKRYNSKVRSKWYSCKRKDTEWIERIRKQANERKRKIIEFLNEYKLEKGCKDCSYRKYAVALDFDHVDGVKERNVCNSKSIKQAMEEIKKCEIVCSNCHRIRTYNRLYPCKPDIFEATYEPATN